METKEMKENSPKKKTLCYKDGRFYFTAEAERTFYFVLTLSMLIAGIVYKIWM